MINLLIVHEFSLMCHIISSALEDESDISVIGFATTVDEALERVKEGGVDIVLLSTKLPDKGSLKLTSLIMQIAPDVKILVLGIAESKDRVLQYVEAGADGYVLREHTLDDLLEAIRTVHAGKAIVSPEMAAALIQRVSELAQVFTQAGSVPPDKINLTDRELEVLDLLGQNLTNQEIADRLVIEVGTVKNHVHNILNKLDVSNREEAAALFALIKSKFHPE